jgi:hypothetical protein
MVGEDKQVSQFGEYLIRRPEIRLTKWIISVTCAVSEKEQVRKKYL